MFVQISDGCAHPARCSLTLTIFDRKSGFKPHMQHVQCGTEIGKFPQCVSRERIFQELGEFSRQKSQPRMFAYPFDFMRMPQFINSAIDTKEFTFINK
jgi:hypothetical protein